MGNGPKTGSGEFDALARLMEANRRPGAGDRLPDLLKDVGAGRTSADRRVRAAALCSAQPIR